MFDKIKKIYKEETFAARSQRMRPAALYAALVATVYVITVSLVNVYTFPNLPLGVDWLQVLQTWLVMTVAFAVFGALTAWFTEEYEGIVGGGVLTTVFLLVFLVWVSRAQPIVFALPLLGASMLGAWAARWSAHRHNAILQERDDLRRKDWIKHITIVLLIGLIPGILGRMDVTSEQAILQLHRLLQAAPSDPSVLPRLPLKQVPALQDHFGVDYRIYARQSTTALGTLDTRIRFSDGFTMTCMLPIGGGNNFITDCVEGNGIPTGP